MISPTVPAAAPSPPQIPSALLRSAPSSNMFITIESAAGSMIAPPSPCTARPAISNASLRRERARQRSDREQGESEHQDPAATEQIRGATAEQQEAAERQRVRGYHPLQARGGQVQIAADRRQRDVDDREIDDRHEVRAANRANARQRLVFRGADVIAYSSRRFAVRSLRHRASSRTERSLASREGATVPFRRRLVSLEVMRSET